MEINPVIPGACAHFDKENSRLLSDPRVKLFIDDGFKWLENSDRQYGAVVTDVEEPFVFHSYSLFSVDYIRMVKKSLKPEGVSAYWMIYISHDSIYLFEMILSEVFKHVEAFIFLWEMPDHQERGLLIMAVSDSEIRAENLLPDKQRLDISDLVPSSTTLDVQTMSVADFFSKNKAFNIKNGEIE